jgi:hypothetical protein
MDSLKRNRVGLKGIVSIRLGCTSHS